MLTSASPDTENRVPRHRFFQSRSDFRQQLTCVLARTKLLNLKKMSTVNLELLVDEIIANNDVVVVEKPEKSTKKKSARAFTDKETGLLISSEVAFVI